MIHFIAANMCKTRIIKSEVRTYYQPQIKTHDSESRGEEEPAAHDN